MQENKLEWNPSRSLRATQEARRASEGWSLAKADPLDLSVLSAPFAVPEYKAQGRGVQVGASRGRCPGAGGEERGVASRTHPGAGRERRNWVLFGTRGERHCGKR